MKPTNPEKLMLLMLSDIYEKLNLTDVNAKLIRSAIHSENTWAIDWGSPGAEPPPPLVIEVVKYLDMWTFLEAAYASFDATNKARVATEAHPFGNPVRFSGFDGNNEGELFSIARILIDDMDRFTNFKGRDLNSHAELRSNYARMYEVFEPIRATLHMGGMSPSQVIDVMKAKLHPN